MDRFSLTDAQWAKMQPLGLGKPPDSGRTGSRWRDLPAPFGEGNMVFERFSDWVKADVFKRMFDAISDDPDMDDLVDATIVRVHRYGQSAKGGLKARPLASLAAVYSS